MNRLEPLLWSSLENTLARPVPNRAGYRLRGRADHPPLIVLLELVYYSITSSQRDMETIAGAGCVYCMRLTLDGAPQLAPGDFAFYHAPNRNTMRLGQNHSRDIYSVANSISLPLLLWFMWISIIPTAEHCRCSLGLQCCAKNSRSQMPSQI